MCLEIDATSKRPEAKMTLSVDKRSNLTFYNTVNGAMGLLRKWTGPGTVFDLFHPSGFTQEIVESSSSLQALKNFADAGHVRGASAGGAGSGGGSREFLQNEKINCYVVGDGTTPRTAALFHCATKWNIWSIDPEMHDSWIAPMDRLHCVKDRAENVPMVAEADFIVIISVHGHANLRELVSKISSPLIVLSIPCCLRKQQILEVPPTCSSIMPVFNERTIASDIHIWLLNST